VFIHLDAVGFSLFPVVVVDFSGSSDVVCLTCCGDESGVVEPTFAELDDGDRRWNVSPQVSEVFEIGVLDVYVVGLLHLEEKVAEKGVGVNSQTLSQQWTRQNWTNNQTLSQQWTRQNWTNNQNKTLTTLSPRKLSHKTMMNTAQYGICSTPKNDNALISHHQRLTASVQTLHQQWQALEEDRLRLLLRASLETATNLTDEYESQAQLEKVNTSEQNQTATFSQAPQQIEENRLRPPSNTSEEIPGQIAPYSMLFP
jgi:hypothetical protein